jgi:hypothetical protein
MGHVNEILWWPDGAALPYTGGVAASNSFVSQWADKRSAPWFSISVVLRGTGTIAGTLSLETSNAIEGGAAGQTGGGGGYGQPAPGISGTKANPDDYASLGVSTAVAAQGKFQLMPSIPVGARWVRVRYTATTSAAGQTASVYWNGIFSST